jgi:hypothetical protein
MADDLLAYDVLVEDALLRGVVREALARVAARGLPEGHHFYITYRTDHPGVVLAELLREQHPDEMTIVIQHQFWDLEVEDDRFAVGLSFSSVPYRLEVPFAAVTAFADPGADFALQFRRPRTAAAEPAAEAPGKGGDDKIVTLGQFRKE